MDAGADHTPVRPLNKRPGERNADDEEARLAAERERGGGVAFIARLERTTEARERQPLALEVDVTRLQFFDPESGLTVDEAART